MCQQVHRESHTLWQNPVDREPIAKGEVWPSSDETSGTEGARIKIRQAELRDYLAARRAGLLVLRFFERGLFSSVQLSGVPEPSDAAIESGTYQWLWRDVGEWIYQSVIEETYWIPPARAIRWHGGSPKHEEPVEFILRDGSRAAYEEGGENDRYWEPITFNLGAVKALASKPGCSIEMDDLTQATIRLRNGGHLRGVVTQQGQFQCMFVDVNRGLNLKQQEQFASLCEVPKQERLYSDDWMKASVEGQFPVRLPVAWIIGESIREINEHWEARFDQTLLAQPDPGAIAVVEHGLRGSLEQATSETLREAHVVLGVDLAAA